MKFATLSFKIPCLIDVRDYHDFDEIKEILRKQFKINQVEIKELGCASTGDYIGVVFDKEKPPAFKEICRLAIKEGFDEMDELTWEGKLIK